MYQKLLLVCASLLPIVCGNVNTSPVIGVLAQPPHLHHHKHKHHQKEEPKYYYVAASYVKWLEAAGARSIPIPYDADDELVDEIFTQINGVLFPGGGCPLPTAARRVWELALAANQKGDFFPIFGICLGFEHILMLASEAGESILQSGFDAENMSIPLNFNNPIESKLYADPEIQRIASEGNVTMNLHIQGIEPSVFAADFGLASMFRITTTNVDRAGRPFVSTIEPLKPDEHPFYGTQYHPEKNTFEYATYPGTNIPFWDINHGPKAIEFSLAIGEAFVSEVRKNTHQYTNPSRHPIVYDYKEHVGIHYEDIYIIPSASLWKDDHGHGGIRTNMNEFLLPLEEAIKVN